uniref:Uncharacterized protein n=1 Tax=Klebsiella pneumoniae TaxID=573 RepID=A0A8B0SWZ0_KLEPN|nr:hypothetical protein [Klebsiella pneumoniae]
MHITVLDYAYNSQHFYIPQSIQTDVKASYSACWSDPGISFWISL